MGWSWTDLGTIDLEPSKAEGSESLGTLVEQCEAPNIAKLVYKSNFTMVYGIYNELVTGAFVNQQTSLGGLIYGIGTSILGS